MKMVVAGVIFLICGCCSPSAMSEKDLLNYLSETRHGLVKEHESNGFKIKLTYKPSDLIAKQQLNNQETVSFDSLSEFYSHYSYFVLEISYANKDLESLLAGDVANYSENVKYINSGLAQSVRLCTGLDTIKVYDGEYINSYGSGSSKFLLVFKSRPKEDFSIEVGGNKVGIGQVFVPFNNSDLEKIPVLKL